MAPTHIRSWLLVVALAAIIAAGAGAWYFARPRFAAREVDLSQYDQYGDRVQTVEAGRLPVFALETGPKAQDAYGFAGSERGEALDWISCYCGCKEIGHRHNRDCYIKARDGRGTTTYTSHGAT